MDVGKAPSKRGTGRVDASAVGRGGQAVTVTGSSHDEGRDESRGGSDSGEVEHCEVGSVVSTELWAKMMSAVLVYDVKSSF